MIWCENESQNIFMLNRAMVVNSQNLILFENKINSLKNNYYQSMLLNQTCVFQPWVD